MEPLVYHEEQRFRQWWVWLLVLGVAGLAWWALIQQVLLDRPFGDNPSPDWGVWLLWTVFGLAFPFGFLRIRLAVSVTPDRILIRFWPFPRRAIPFADIRSTEARKYNAITEYGGWGVKGWLRNKMAYNVSGQWGVELTLVSGRKIMLGSKRPHELAAAIELQRRAGGRVRPV